MRFEWNALWSQIEYLFECPWEFILNFFVGEGGGGGRVAIDGGEKNQNIKKSENC